MDVRVASAEEMGSEVARFMRALSPVAQGATILALSGDLGAGKTTFAQAAARTLGVEETVASPTFVIEKMYDLVDQKWKRLIHIDAYRLESEAELERLGWKEVILDAGNLIVIEWPERVSGLMPPQAARIVIAIGEGSERTISYGD